MKVFQIVGGICYKDVTVLAQHHDLTKITALHIETAPDNVFAGWGFDPDREGDERFVMPTAPEGFIYNTATGTFEPEVTPEPQLTRLDEIEAQVTYTAMMTDTLLEV